MIIVVRICRRQDSTLLSKFLMYDVFRMCELMFETFDVPAVFMSKDAVLSCYAVGRTSGLVIDCGASGKLDHQSPCRI